MLHKAQHSMVHRTPTPCPAPGGMISPICEALPRRNPKPELISGRVSILLSASAQTLAAGLRGSRSSKAKSDLRVSRSPFPGHKRSSGRWGCLGQPAGPFPTAQGGCSVHRPGAPRFTQDLCAQADWIPNETQLLPSPNPF